MSRSRWVRPQGTPTQVTRAGDRRRYDLPVVWWALALWGTGGVVIVELLDWAGAIKRTGTFPWRNPKEPKLGPFLFSAAVRIAAAAFVTAGGALNGQVTTILAAAGVGIAAPVILEKLAKSATAIAGPSAHDVAPAAEPGSG